MQKQNLKVLAVDDDEINLEILVKNLNDNGYEAIACSDGQEAWDLLQKDPHVADILLLDKMMPKMDGMELLSLIQKHEIIKNIPVILQTGDVGVKEMKEGLAAGAYYYLCKPFDPSVMISLVNAAARDFVQRNSSHKASKQEKILIDFLHEGIFRIKNINDAIQISKALSQTARFPDRINTALLELTANAIEHGNLGIGYESKGLLISENRLDNEIEKLANDPANIDKFVEIEMKQQDNFIEVTITDQGDGFDWVKFLQFEPIRLTEPNGRGIAASKLMGVDIDYIAPGNKVVCRFAKS